jgi:hypothetical protein
MIDAFFDNYFTNPVAESVIEMVSFFTLKLYDWC